MMKLEITVPNHLPDLKEEDGKAAALRSERYSIVRDLQAKEFNEAIAFRLAREKEMQELAQRENKEQINCEKCGKKFSAGITAKDSDVCPECSQEIEID
jgi:DNA-directed RNA polymerase subunit RPC12/RpoP